MKAVYTDVLIIGSGIAGLVCAEKLSRTLNVRVVTHSKMQSCNSYFAQGGIAASIGSEDSWEEHLADTMEAGAGHCNFHAAHLLLKEGKNIYQYLSEIGVEFDTNEDGSIIFGLEGGHRKKRILHAGGDQTGKFIVNALYKKLQERKVFTYGTAADLIMKDGRCCGAWYKTESGADIAVFAAYTIMCTGGFAGLYDTTTNVRQASGSGIAMAYRAGAALCDLEFVQFHPTLLKQNGKVWGLISEAVRGEGARLIDNTGKLLMEKIHPLKDLAPRDVVAREIQRALEAGKSVFLDISVIADFESRFPSITKMCRAAGIEPGQGMIPAVPGAHFTMGGIITDDRGRSTIEGLYAAGECARTGIHGANRLASNSLLEGAGMAMKISETILQQTALEKMPENHGNAAFPVEFAGNGGCSLPELHVIKEGLSRCAGIVRKEETMAGFADFLERYPSIKPDVNHSLSDLEKINAHVMAWLAVTSALKRCESRGGHYRSDYPHPREEWHFKIIERRIDIDEQTAALREAAGIFY
ncbi:L-aspartate oxidase [Fictibacillus aquaticus]|uniref:L-aspartate oxidase n=1 Tax=Fictibacillus aquaticus TaxID=2021314 RepID=A0A235FAN0_9BACL|nr:L-aspartate oxidase [Fictibacillus aquaticus]OYD58054.1 L-aspartate oxidase [Fictibacillus aquaticus]